MSDTDSSNLTIQEVGTDRPLIGGPRAAAKPSKFLKGPAFKIIAGAGIVAAINAHLEATVLPSRFRPGCNDSESLCAHQREMSARGYLGVEIVQSIYGHSVRYDSGLQNFGLLASSRSLGGTLDAAVAFAVAWQAADPARRYVWTRDRT